MDERIRFSFPFSSCLLLYALSTIALICPLLIECIEYTIGKSLCTHHLYAACQLVVDRKCSCCWVPSRISFHLNVRYTRCVCLVLCTASHCVRMLMKYSLKYENVRECVLFNGILLLLFLFICLNQRVCVCVCYAVRVHSAALYCVRLIIVSIALFPHWNDKLLHKNNGHALGYLWCFKNNDMGKCQYS